MQLEPLQALTVVVFFLLVLVLVHMTVTGWPESLGSNKLANSYYLTLLGLFSTTGNLLLLFFDSLGSWLYFPSLLLSVVVLGFSFPSYLTFRKTENMAKFHQDTDLSYVLKRSILNAFAVSFTSIICLIAFTWNGEFQNESLLFVLVLTLAMILITHNVSTIFYLYRHKSGE